jgi:flagellar biosynthesis protein FlhG
MIGWTLRRTAPRHPVPATEAPWRGIVAVSAATDQSAGLRRLLARKLVRSVTLVGGKPGIGRTAVLSNVAVALARLGRSVLLLDQNGGRACAAARLGLSPGRDLAEVIERGLPLEEAIVHAPEGLRVLRGARAFDLLGNLPPAAEERLGQAFERLQPRLDYILVDAPAGDAVHTPSLSLGSQEVIVMVSPHPESVTRAYALVERLSWDLARRRFYILANGVRSPEQGGILYDNIARTARALLNLQLEYLGCVPEDDALRKACRLRQPVSRLFPASAASVACAVVADAIDQWPFPGEDCLDGDVQRLLRPLRAAALSG